MRRRAGVGCLALVLACLGNLTEAWVLQAASPSATRMGGPASPASTSTSKGPLPAALPRGGRARPSPTSLGMAPFDDTDSLLDPRELKVRAVEAQFLDRLTASPFMAVLRGVEGGDVADVVAALQAEGVTLASVPAEAPAGIGSIRGVLSDGTRERMMVGAATVISTAQVDAAANAGASFISCPHVDPEIIQRAHARGMVVLPGVMTPTEAFLAVRHGATVLKLFPSQAIPPGMVKSMRAVLPPHVRLLVSGGVQPEDMRAYTEAGAIGFALGSTLYKPGISASELGRRAQLFREAAAATGALGPSHDAEKAKAAAAIAAGAAGADAAERDRVEDFWAASLGV